MTAAASAPASSGNLGPGFDMLALALELRCRVEAKPADEWSVTHLTEHRPDDEAGDYALASAKDMTDRPLALTVENEIPLGKGLGSSSAARAAAAAAALLATEGTADPQRVYEYVSGFEGHPDNAAAAVFGGFVGVTPEGTPVQLPLALRWRVVVAIPDHALPTKEARSVLGTSIERDAVVRSLARFMSLLEGLRTGDPSVLSSAGGDELHEAPRAGLNPDAGVMIKAAHAAGAPHAAWSGAGPAVIAFADGADTAPVAEALRSAMGSGEVRVMDVAMRGLVISS